MVSDGFQVLLVEFEAGTTTARLQPVRSEPFEDPILARTPHVSPKSRRIQVPAQLARLQTHCESLPFKQIHINYHKFTVPEPVPPLFHLYFKDMPLPPRHLQ